MNRREFLLGALSLEAVPPVAFAKSAADATSGRLRIAHMTDPQLGFSNPKDPEASYAADLRRFEREIEIVNAMAPDLALITGDMTHLAEDVARDWPRLVKMFKVPLVVAPGNHDIGLNVDKSWRDRYLSVFGYDYKALDVAGWRVIVGNTQFWHKTEIKDEQTKYEEWLKAELEAAKSYNGRVVLAGHIPPFADKFYEKDSYENYPKSGRVARMKMYLDAGAKFFLAGHTHRMIAHGWRELTILNAETTSRNFDARPYGFRMFEVADEYDYSYKFVRVDT